MKEFSDYEFLSEEDPLIYSILTSAQSYVRTDPNTALIKLRQFAEILVGAIASKNCFEETLNKGLADQIVILEKQGFLPSTESRRLHRLRIEGNKAVHPDPDNLEGDFKVAQQHIEKAIHLVYWFQKTYRDASKISVSLEIDKKPAYGKQTTKEYFELSQQFDSINTHFHRLESSRGDLLNVVLLGEFRTRNLTLANLLIGQDIPPRVSSGRIQEGLAGARLRHHHHPAKFQKTSSRKTLNCLFGTTRR